MKLDEIFIAYMTVFMFILTCGMVIITEFTPCVTEVTRVMIYMGDDVFEPVEWYERDHNTFQYNLGISIMRYSFLLALPAVYVNRLGEWWKKR